MGAKCEWLLSASCGVHFDGHGIRDVSRRLACIWTGPFKMADGISAAYANICPNVGRFNFECPSRIGDNNAFILNATFRAEIDVTVE